MKVVKQRRDESTPKDYPASLAWLGSLYYLYVKQVQGSILPVLIPNCSCILQQHSYKQSIFIKSLNLVCITSTKAIQHVCINFVMYCTTSHLCLHPHGKHWYGDLDPQRSHLQVLEVSAWHGYHHFYSKRTQSELQQSRMKITLISFIAEDFIHH